MNENEVKTLQESLDSLYTMDESVNDDAKVFNFMEPGIHENVEMTEVKYDVSEKGTEFLAFSFQDENGKSLSHTEYKVTATDPKILVTRTGNQKSRVKHIAKRFVEEDKLNFKATSFKDWAEKIVALLNGNFKGKKVRVKIVYGRNNYTTFPPYVPFIESMDVPKGGSILTIGNNDKMIKSSNGDVENKQSENPFDTPVTTSEPVADSQSATADDLPF